MRKKKSFCNFLLILTVFVLGVVLGHYQQNPSYFNYLYKNLPNDLKLLPFKGKNDSNIIHHSISQLGRSKVSTCFTPPAGCTAFIVNEINQATESIYMQAYGMSDILITEALIKAQSRGVNIQILLDRSNLSQKFSKMHELQKAKIEVGIDKVPGIAHNKVIIIDKEKVMTGSFNFTKSADIRNAENVIVIEDLELANTYLQNWLSRKNYNSFKKYP